MANFSALKTAIQNAIKQNGNEEITGDVLQQILLSIVNTMGDGAINTIEQNLSNETLARQGADNTLQQNIDAEALARGNADTQLQNAINAIKADIDNGYVYAGIATPSSTPVSGKVFYIATVAGTYTNFGGQVLTQGINILRFNGSAWSSHQLIGIDDVPTAGSNNLVKSGGVQNELALGAVYDVSAKNPTAGPNNDGKWESLSALLSDANLNTLIPTAYRKGGMSIKFVQTSDNKYIQARLMANSFTTDVTQWQGVDGEPTAGSDNLVKSGGIESYVGKRIFKLIGFFYNPSSYAPNWVIGDVAFITNTNKIVRCTKVNDSGSMVSWDTIPFDDTTIYLYNNIMWKWNGNGIVPLSKIMTLTSIANDAAITEMGQFWYSSTYKVVRVCTHIIGTTKRHYDLSNVSECLFLWNGDYYMLDSSNILKRISDITYVNTAINTTKDEVYSYIDTQTLKNYINLVYIGSNATMHSNWVVGDMMYDVTNNNLKRCTAINQSGQATSFQTITPLPGTIYDYNGVLYKIDETEEQGLKMLSKVVEVKSITNSTGCGVGDYYLSSTNKDLRLMITDSAVMIVPCFDDTLFLFNNNLYRILNNNIVKINGDNNSGGIFTSTFASEPATTSIPLSTINTNGKTLQVGDLIIANSDHSYLYNITAINSTDVSVSYYSGLKGNTGNRGDRGEQGNSGYTGAAEELEVVNNLNEGGATKALSAEQGKILSNWTNYNSSPLVIKPKNPKSLQLLDLSDWQAGENGTVGSNVEQIYDDITQEYVDVRPLASTNSTNSDITTVFSKQIPQGVDLTTSVFRGAIYIDTNFNPEDLNYIRIVFSSSGNTSSSNYNSQFTLYSRNNNNYYNRTGWWHFCFNLNKQAIFTGSSFDITNVTRVVFAINHSANTTVNLAVTKFDILPSLKKPGIVTIVDNFNPNVPAMAEYAASKGVRLNLSIIPNWIESGSSNSGTLQQVYNAAKQGHFIFNHTWNHQIYGGQSILEVFEQINKADRWMIEHGFSRGSKILSNPSAAFDNDKYKAYFASQAAMIFHHWTTYYEPRIRTNGSTECILYYPYKGMDRLLNISLLDSTFNSDFTKLVPSAILGANAALDYGGILVCGFHGYGTEYGGYMPDDTTWKAYIDAIAELDIYHYTIDELLEGAYI